MNQVARYFAAARERYAIHIRKDLKELPAPWTEDPVFRQWRFCNVHREDDRVTRWFEEYVRKPYRLDINAEPLDIVFATIAFRWFNLPSVGEKLLTMLLGGITWWSSHHARELLRDVSPIVTGAYMVTSKPGMDKLDGILWCLDEALVRLPDIYRDEWSTLEEAHAALQTLPYVGRFTAYEIVTDLYHTQVLGHASDVMTWASAGPGCARGIGRVIHDNPQAFNYGSRECQSEMRDYMLDILSFSQETHYWPEAWPPWTMREVEHWACEFDKYERGRLGERLKRRYR